ncbi:MAG: DUF2764 family protein [Candidatus Omnitrophota bacterium]|nr:DUF2764 family protein [Candidatus Omnitrophota bacterium]MDZ4242480.1 DUF2764 family protein [Candidatus Omnitrophota bacterium]
MSRAYYYVVASLPMLEFGARPPLTGEAFLAECRRLTDPRDFDLIQKAYRDDPAASSTENTFWQDWAAFSRELRNQLVVARARNLGKDAAPYLKETSARDMVVNLVGEALKAPDPWTAEKILDRGRWLRLDELSQGHHFDLEMLIAYAVRLRILERHQAVASSRGAEIYEGYKNAVLTSNS